MLLPLDQGDSLIVGLIWKEWMMVVDNNHVEFHDQTWPVLETNKNKIKVQFIFFVFSILFFMYVFLSVIVPWRIGYCLMCFKILCGSDLSSHSRRAI